MDTHALALFLHPICRKLAVSQSAKARSFDDMVRTALTIAKQWRWPEPQAKLLLDDLRKYHQSKSPFAGGGTNALVWWKDLSVDPEKHPLKQMAITIHSIVPHATKIECLFSALGGVQSAKRCNLAVETFKTLRKLRSNYSFQLYNHYKSIGKAVRCQHRHMHICSDAGISLALTEDLATTFTWQPPSITAENPSFTDDDLAGFESVTLEELNEAFGMVGRQVSEDMGSGAFVNVDGAKVLEGKIYDFGELDKVNKGLVPPNEVEDLSIIGSEDGGGWNIDTIMTQL